MKGSVFSTFPIIMDSYDLMRSFVVRYNAANKQETPPHQKKKVFFFFYAIVEICDIIVWYDCFSPHLFPDTQDKAAAFRDCVSLYYPIVHMDSSRMPKYLDLEVCVWVSGCLSLSFSLSFSLFLSLRVCVFCMSLFIPIVHVDSSRMPKYLDLEGVCVYARTHTHTHTQGSPERKAREEVLEKFDKTAKSKEKLVQILERKSQVP